MSQQENLRKAFFSKLHTKAKDLEVPDGMGGRWSENDFIDLYPNNNAGYENFKSMCFGSVEYCQRCYDWLINEKCDDNSPILNVGTTIDSFYKNFVCDAPFAKATGYCVTGTWEDGKRDTTKSDWLEHFPCLKKYFSVDTLNIMADDQGFTYFVNKNPKNGKIYHFYSDGQIWTDTDEDTGKKWRCSSQRGKSNVIVEIYKSTSVLKEQISFDIGGGTSTGGGNTGGGNTGGGTPSGWNEHCDGTDANPYKVGCKSANIGKAQGCLGSLYTGIVDDKFGKLTLSAIKQKLGKDTFTIEDLNRKICDIKFDDSDDSSLENTSDLP
jgi:hypothetical protein